MNIGIILFAYNRNQHLKKVLDGLSKNIGVSKLYIFQDGLKCEEHREGWEKTQQVIQDIDWCEVVYKLSFNNKGLANSIVDGITTVFKENDAVIVLEDDCVPAANFISFMQQCFEKYQADKKVYSISGYAWPIDLEQDEYDIYGCGRISSWGWGTWKDRWEQYIIDNDILKRLKKDKEKSRYLAAWGSDCEQMLLNRIAGKNDSWAIYWGLIVFENRGICINPYKSLIHNIGLDGTGVHCGITDQFETKLDNEKKMDFNLPDELEILHTTEYAFADLHGNYTAASNDDKSKENVLIYGLGNFFYQYEKEVNKNYNIMAFIDQWKTGWYAGRRILKLSDVINYDYDKIIIMVRSIQECMKIVREMINKGVKYESIILGQSLYGIYSKNIDKIYVMYDGGLSLKFNNSLIKVETEGEFNSVCETFINHIYRYFINNARRDIVFDVGMNIGDSSLYFVQQENVEKVYGYESIKKIFIRAEENLRQYLDMDKLSIFQYDISNENVSKIFEPIFHKYPHYNMILKIDCNGEECGILEKLYQSEILEKFKVIMIKEYYWKKKTVLDCLEKAGFSWWYSKKNAEMGLVYAYRCKQ